MPAQFETSGETEWCLTARDIIREALFENSIIAIGEEPTAEEAERCLVRLNALLKSWRVGRHLEKTGTITIPAGERVGTIDDQINEVMSARVIETVDYERQLARWTRDEYFRLPNKNTQGSPTCFYADAQRERIELYVWPVPLIDTQFKVDFLRLPETITNLNQVVDFPQEYQEALYTNLAVRIAGVFGEQPSQELYMRATEFKRLMEDRERPASYYLGIE